MAAARFNSYWYLSLLAPLLIMGAATYWRNKSVLWAGAVASLVVTYALCNLAVQTKWMTRWELAKTEEEVRYASGDGGNLVGTAIISGPFAAIVYTSFWGFLGRRVWERVRPRQRGDASRGHAGV